MQQLFTQKPLERLNRPEYNCDNKQERGAYHHEVKWSGKGHNVLRFHNASDVNARS